jgi:hypothetical protein
VLDQKPAEQLSKIVMSMKDKDSRQKAGGISGYDEYSQFQTPSDSDSIPF